MKKLFALLLALLALCAAAGAEEEYASVREYAEWLEEALPDADFADAEVPEFCVRYLGEDYDLLARSGAKYGAYVACARKASAPPLPADVELTTENEFSPGGYQRVWTLRGGGEVLYRFILGENVELQAYDHYTHLIVVVQDGAVEPFRENEAPIFDAADVSRRKQLESVNDTDFEADAGRYDGSDWVQEHAQLAVEVHDADTWRAGVTDQPTFFYLNAEDLPPLTTQRNMPRERADGFDYFEAAIPIGVYYYPAGRNARDLAFVLSPDGTPGLRDIERQCIWEAGPGFVEALNRVEAILGYRPGDADFLGKTSVRATLEWDGENTLYDKSGVKTIEDADALRRLDALFNAADLGQGGYNCPSPCFLTMKYTDGSSASIAVAINSFDYFFYHGLGIRTEEDILGIFGLSGDYFRNGSEETP